MITLQSICHPEIDGAVSWTCYCVFVHNIVEVFFSSGWSEDLDFHLNYVEKWFSSKLEMWLNKAQQYMMLVNCIIHSASDFSVWTLSIWCFLCKGRTVLTESSTLIEMNGWHPKTSVLDKLVNRESCQGRSSHCKFSFSTHNRKSIFILIRDLSGKSKVYFSL